MDATAKQVAAIVGPRIRRTRRRLDMSQEVLADNAEIHRTQMTAIEWGERLPRIDALIKLAGGLGISPCELLDGIVWEVRRESPRPDGGDRRRRRQAGPGSGPSPDVTMTSGRASIETAQTATTRTSQQSRDLTGQKARRRQPQTEPRGKARGGHSRPSRSTNHGSRHTTNWVPVPLLGAVP